MIEMFSMRALPVAHRECAENWMRSLAVGLSLGGLQKSFDGREQPFSLGVHACRILEKEMIGRSRIERQMLDALLERREAPRRQHEGTAAVGRLVNTRRGDSRSRIAAVEEVDDIRIVRIDEEIGNLECLRQTRGELPTRARVGARSSPGC